MPLTFSHKYLIIDASCIINFYASGKMEEILKSIPKSITVAAYVFNKETLWIYDGPQEDIKQNKRQINLQPFVAAQLLHIVDLESDEESNLFVEFAAKMDDGEAITGAIAVHRNWVMVVDDKKARAFFQREFPHLQLVYSLEIVKHWIDATHLQDNAIFSALWHIRKRGTYTPPKNHPLFSWWKSYINE